MIYRLLSGWFNRLSWEYKIFVYAGLVSLLPLLSFVLTKDKVVDTTRPKTLTDVDTIIPRGFVLVPIEVKNYESLDSILGKFGVVDLFQPTSTDENKQILIAKNVRILRAPQNPTQFAVLISENESHRILKSGGIFTVVLKRPNANGMEFVKDPKKKTIIYGDN